MQFFFIDDILGSSLAGTMLTLCHDSNSKANTANKLFLGFAYVKKKKKLIGIFGIWALNNTFAQMLKVNFQGMGRSCLSCEGSLKGISLIV